MKVDVRTDKYIFVHGRKPRGFGLWYFIVGDELIAITGNYSQAKDEAIRYAIRHNVARIDVMP